MRTTSTRTTVGLLLAAVLALAPVPATSEPVVAAGYTVQVNCPNLGTLANLPVGDPNLRPGQMAFSRDGRKVYIVYQSDPGEVHVRDLEFCTQTVLVRPMDGPLGIAVHPYTGNLYVSHKYFIDPTRVPRNFHSNVRAAVSIFHPDGTLLVSRWVTDLPPSNFGLSPNITATGAQGLTFDRAGNLYISLNVNVFERDVPRPVYLDSSLLKADRHGQVSIFATGIRAAFEAAVAKESGDGEAKAFFQGDNGEGDYCVAGGSGCTGRNSEPGRFYTRMYYDELNYVVRGMHYGYPESAPNLITTAAANVDHVGPLWNFEKLSSGPFADMAPVPTGIAYLDGRWGKIDEPVFLTFWRGGLDVFSGPNKAKRQNLVSGLDQTIDVALRPPSNDLYFMEYNTGLIYVIRPQ